MKKSKEGYLYAKDIDYKFPFDENPLNEYPRPQLRRDSYLSLNGLWDFMLTKEDEKPFSYEDRILVPYAVESHLSGVEKLVKADDIMFYHKKVILPDEFLNGILLINFDGIDQICEIYIDDVLVTYSLNPYKRIVVKLEEYKKEFDITVKVKDFTDKSYYQRGKQSTKTNGYFYTSSSGIYKSVWIEKVPKAYIESVAINPSYDNKTVSFFIKSNNYGDAIVKIDEKDYKIKVNEECKIKFENIHPYSDSDPFLYDVKINYLDDEVYSYFGIRKVDIRSDDDRFKHIYINDKKTFLSGVLYQGYYYLGNLTPLKNDDMYQDLKRIKDLGFNAVRVHIKIESDLFYYYADRLGLYVIQDFPSGGDSYSFLPTVLPRLFPILSNDKVCQFFKKGLGRKDKRGEIEFEKEMFEYVNSLYNHPSILIYTIFNEGWGEFDPKRLYYKLKETYPDILFDTASGWYDSDSDFYSVHTYTIPSKKRKDKKNRCFIISEMGGIGYKDDLHSLFPGYFAHKKFKSVTALENKIKKLYQKELYPLKKIGLAIIIYTQFNDVESEYNGLYTFDREVLKVSDKLLIDLNKLMIEDN